MIIRKKAEGSYLAVPVLKSQKTEEVKVSCGSDFLYLNIGAVPAEKADYVVEYKLPFDWKNTFLEAEERFFSLAGFRDSPEGETVSRNTFFHLSAVHGWLNDPNGLYYRNGLWHAFFQYNPFSSGWGNMHWNHAVSKDLLHWEEKDLALYPDHEGRMFSGGSLIDKDNVSGLGKGALLLFYTNAFYGGGSSQNLAYSLDDGKTFRKYEKNPLIPGVTNLCDRDPAPVYDPEEKVYYMPVFIGDEVKKEFYLYLSHDLLHWEHTDTYLISGGRECPGLVRMQDLSDGTWKWVFTEANAYYRVAQIRNGKITFLTDPQKFLYCDAYAGQFFQNTPNGKKVYLPWIRMPGCENTFWNGCMALPLEITLENNALFVKPYTVPERRGRLEKAKVPFEAELKFTPGKCAFFRLGRKVFLFDFPAGKLIANGTEIPLPADLKSGRLFVDTASAEFYDDSGKIAFCSFTPESADFSCDGFEVCELFSLSEA